jgi:coenzyme F420 biosynthesis associated uncharacterized protein
VSDAGLVDWGLAERVATALAGSPGAASLQSSRPFGPEAVAAACEEAVVKVSAYTRLEATSAVPAGESVGRAEWVRAGLGTMRELATDLERRLGESMTLPGPLGTIVRGIAGRAAGAEAGAAVGFASRRVLGQYDISLNGAERAPRLLLVEPNLAGTHRELGGEPGAFLEWVALHETTHALQFGSVEWLRPRLSALLGKLLDASASGLDTAQLRELAKRLVTSDPRRTVRALLQGELARTLASPGQTELLDEMQATMAVVEGYAEHVMDRAAPEREAEFAKLRKLVQERRQNRGGLGEAIARMLGMELKMRQYKLGKAFCDAVVESGGIETLNRVWSAPAALPSLDELEAPDAWLVRVGEPAVA